MSFSMTLKECREALGLSDSAFDDVLVSGVSIDSRTLVDGDLYIAIKGERFNGHDFIGDAKARGATAVIADEPVECELPVLMVENTVTALGSVAKAWADRFKIQKIAITGSNGKTTVKEIVTTILQQLGPVLSTQGNLNNEIGVPLTLLRLRPEHLYAVVELGANHAGEIARMVSMVKPDVAIITNIGTAHLEGFGSVEGIAKAKSEIFSGLDANGYAVINANDAYAEFLRSASSHCRRREFGLTSSADVRGVAGAGFTFLSMGKKLTPKFQLSGDHNGMNALASIAAVECLDVQHVNIVRGLEKVKGVPGRLEKKPGYNNSLLIDDTYNANPDSAEQAIRVLARFDGVRYLVLGDMAELGNDAEALHERVGKFAKDAGIDGIWTTGALASHAYKAYAGSISTHNDIDNSKASTSASTDQIYKGAHFSNQELLVEALTQYLTVGVTVLVKGSRSARMERVVKALSPKQNSPHRTSLEPSS